MLSRVLPSHAAHLHSGETVAVKVQRPGMPLLLTLDALLFDMIGGQLKRFAKAQKDLLVAVNEMVRLSCLSRDLSCSAVEDCHNNTLYEPEPTVFAFLFPFFIFMLTHDKLFIILS